MTPRHLLLVRHAKATWEHGATTDFDRLLTEEGRNDADELAAWLAAHSPCPSAIVTSTAPRALATAERLAKAWPHAPTLTLEPSLYEAPLDGPARLIAGLPDAWDRVLMVGHNPALSHTADWLLGEPTILELPAGGLVWLEINAPFWRSIVPGGARVRAMQAPGRVVQGR